MSDEAHGIDLEITERVGSKDYQGIAELGIVKPNTFRINGQRVLIPATSSIEFEPLDEAGVMTVRLSLMVRNLRVGTECSDDPDLFSSNTEALAALMKTGTTINHRDAFDLRPSTAQGAGDGCTQEGREQEDSEADRDQPGERGQAAGEGEDSRG